MRDVMSKCSSNCTFEHPRRRRTGSDGNSGGSGSDGNNGWEGDWGIGSSCDSFNWVANVQCSGSQAFPHDPLDDLDVWL